MRNNIGEKIKRYFGAGFPAVAVETQEPGRLLREVVDAFRGGDAQICRVAAAGGLKTINGKVLQSDNGGAMGAYLAAWQRAAANPPALVIVEDFQHFCRTPAMYRPLLDAIPAIKTAGGLLVLAAPHWLLPPELEREMPVISHGLPKRTEIHAILARLAPPGTAIQEEAVEAALGLTESEAENAAALAYDMDRRAFDPTCIEEQKILRIRETAGLEISPAGRLEDIGGLDPLKTWLQEEVAPFRRDPQLAVRGMLFVGPPGVGKSLTARAVGAVTNSPVIRLDLSACRGQYQGQTEQSVRHALRVAEAVAPCVLWLDEIDSALGGHVSSGATDGGVTLAVVSILLTWIEQHQSPITLVATANHPERIPAPLMRPGRIGDIWCVDLPTPTERNDIARLHLIRTGCYADAEDAQERIAAAAELIAAESDQFSGAEIAGAVRSAARRGRRNPTQDDIRAALGRITPLAVARKDDLSVMREWAKTYANPANRTEHRDRKPARRLRTA